MWELLHFLTSYNKSFITQETVFVGTTTKLKNYSFLTLTPHYNVEKFHSGDQQNCFNRPFP